MILDHICFATKNLEEAILFWQNYFSYTQYTLPVTNTRQKVKVVFLKKTGSTTIKIIEPIEGNTNLKKFVNQGGGFHHICFKCDNVIKEIKILREKGLKLLAPAQPGEAFDNNLIAFFMGMNTINIEIIDTDKKVIVIDNIEK